MSTIISLVSQKGGVGKSAIARLLAVEFMRAGWSVKIADLDTMQGTSTKWKLRRDAAKVQPEVPVEKFATIERAVREAEKYDLLLVDGPAHAEKGGLTFSGPVLPELPSIRQGHSGGKAASEVSFPAIRERATALAEAVAAKLEDLTKIQSSAEAA